MEWYLCQRQDGILSVLQSCVFVNWSQWVRHYICHFCPPGQPIQGQRSPRRGGYLVGSPSLCASSRSCPSLSRSVGMSIRSSSSFHGVPNSEWILCPKVTEAPTGAFYSSGSSQGEIGLLASLKWTLGLQVFGGVRAISAGAAWHWYHCLSRHRSHIPTT